MNIRLNALRNTITGSSHLLAIACLALPISAATTIADSSLTSSTSLYSNSYGNVVVMTDGGNAPGIGDPTGRNDDGFSGPINLGFSLNFYGGTYNQFYINNNGNVSFGNGISAYTPDGPTGATQPIISPFFGDVDTRGANSGVVHLAQSANQDIITWDHVGYYSAHDDKLNTFQLVLRGSGYNVPAGEGQIGFFYTGMQWETGDASGGTGGFGGSPAAIGFGNGSGDGQILQNSTTNGISGIVNNHYIWFGLNDTGVPVVTPPTPTAAPEPASIGLLLTGVGALVFAGRKYRNGSSK